MKKIKYLIFALLLSFVFIPNAFAKGNVEIKSIELDSKSDNTVVKKDPTFNGLEMNFGLAFKTKGDYAKYKIVIKNDTNTDYKITEDTSFNASEYITYKYNTDSLVKAKDETTVYVTITYSKEIASSLLVDGKYTENNKAIVQLVDKDGKVVNPKTNTTNAIILVTLLIVSLVIVLSLKKKNKLKYSTLALIIGIVSIPTFVSAVESLKLTMNVNVEIEKGYRVDYLLSHISYIKDSELSSYDVSDSSCRILYVGSVSEENKYHVCDFAIFKDGRLYSPGETVTLKSIPVRYIYFDSEPQLIGENEFLSTDAKVIERDYTITQWEYSSSVSSQYGYSVFKNDKSIMNFNEYGFDGWEDNGFFEVYSHQRFTMPAHDALFKEIVESFASPSA